jgi:hypothetical protein
MVDTLRLKGKVWKICSKSTFQIQEWQMNQEVDRGSQTWMYRDIKWTGDTGICPGVKWINPKLDELQLYLYQLNNQEQMRLYLHFCSNGWSICIIFHQCCIFVACLAPRPVNRWKWLLYWNPKHGFPKCPRPQLQQLLTNWLNLLTPLHWLPD